jgi:hypothetical protein
MDGRRRSTAVGRHRTRRTGRLVRRTLLAVLLVAIVLGLHTPVLVDGSRCWSTTSRCRNSSPPCINTPELEDAELELMEQLERAQAVLTCPLPEDS